MDTAVDLRQRIAFKIRERFDVFVEKGDRMARFQEVAAVASAAAG